PVLTMARNGFGLTVLTAIAILSCNLVIFADEAQCPSKDGFLCKQRDITKVTEDLTELIDSMSTELKADMNALREQISELCKMTPSCYRACPTSDQIGCSEKTAAKSCLEILQAYENPPPSGIYWVNLSRNNKVQVYCDMTTEEGGWMLVWRFTFTNYDDFAALNNSITPRPSWNLDAFMSEEGIADVKVPVSKTPPRSEEQLGALEFKYWKQIGKSFIIKSNIINWIMCEEDEGGITTEFKDGEIKCKVIKVINTDATNCTTVAPNSAWWSICGLNLRTGRRNSNYIKFDIRDTICSAQWDPCGKGPRNGHVRNVPFPHGSIFIR
ncbi:unnamed protein product, partial [Owenia fusiformis]